MAKYALVDPADAIVSELDERFVDPSVSTKDGYRWLIVEVVREDTTTQSEWVVTDPPVIEVLADRVRKTITTRDMTSAEIDTVKTNIVMASVDELQFRHLFNLENRVRTLEGKSTITKEQYRNALKGML